MQIFYPNSQDIKIIVWNALPLNLKITQIQKLLKILLIVIAMLLCHDIWFMSNQY